MTIDELARRIGEPGLALLDVRTAEEFSGEGGYPCDPRQGHIVGARHVDVRRLLGASEADVRAIVERAEGAEVIAYCHSGQRSAKAVEVLRAAGYEARNYTGSWHEWSRREDLPAER